MLPSREALDTVLGLCHECVDTHVWRRFSCDPLFSEPSVTNPDCEIRLGIASWDDGSGTAKSVKFTWFDKNGKAARGGELPVEALPKLWPLQSEKGTFVSLANRCPESALEFNVADYEGAALRYRLTVFGGRWDRLSNEEKRCIHNVVGPTPAILRTSRVPFQLMTITVVPRICTETRMDTSRRACLHRRCLVRRWSERPTRPCAVARGSPFSASPV